MSTSRRLMNTLAICRSRGHILSANDRHLLRDGGPWFPVMGEFHYTRFPEDEWEREILAMKAAGIQVVSSYVIWIHHEEIEGQFDWAGRHNLRRFVELCARHGLYFSLRVGPWVHSEVRNGGLPNWVGTSRRNDATYLAAVRRFFGESGALEDRVVADDVGRAHTRIRAAHLALEAGRPHPSA